MAILKEYVCFAHGKFEATEARCPKGCTTAIERDFRTAPGIKSPRTRNIDKTLAGLAADFGYTDISNKKGSVAASQRKAPDFRPVWGDVPKGDVMKAGGVIEKREGSRGGASAAATASRVHDPENAKTSFTEIAGQMTPPRPAVDPKFTYGTAADLSAAIKSLPA